MRNTYLTDLLPVFLALTYVGYKDIYLFWGMQYIQDDNFTEKLKKIM